MKGKNWKKKLYFTIVFIIIEEEFKNPSNNEARFNYSSQRQLSCRLNNSKTLAIEFHNCNGQLSQNNLIYITSFMNTIYNDKSFVIFLHSITYTQD